MNSPRVFFIGIHNKPGCSALDSSTKTGKMIDKVIELMPGVRTVKTNLYDTAAPELPLPYSAEDALKWMGRVGYTDQDIAVTLGESVRAALDSAQIPAANLIHPSAIWAKGKREKYPPQAVVIIENHLRAKLQDILLQASNHVLNAGK